MAHVSVIVRKQKNKEGLYPLVIRITAYGKSVFIHTKQFIKLSDWDSTKHRVKRSHPYSIRLNNSLERARLAVEEFILEERLAEQGLSAIELKRRYTKRTTKLNGVDFFPYSEQWIEKRRRNGMHKQVQTDVSRLKYVKQFAGVSLRFNDISIAFLQDLRNWLVTERNLGERSVQNYFLMIRTIFNSAIREHIVPSDQYPFGRGKVVIKFPETAKIGLSREELTKLEMVSKNEISPAQWHARNIWLFSFYTAGMRISDVLKLRFADIQNGRINYRMQKNGKVVQLPVIEKAQIIINEYRQQDPDATYIFPELNRHPTRSMEDQVKRIANVTRNINRRLALLAEHLGIQKKLSTHIARHTFATLAGGQIPIQLLQKLYRHSEIKTTIQYQQGFIRQDLDNAVLKVING